MSLRTLPSFSREHDRPENSMWTSIKNFEDCYQCKANQVIELVSIMHNDVEMCE